MATAAAAAQLRAAALDSCAAVTFPVCASPSLCAAAAAAAASGADAGPASSAARASASAAATAAGPCASASVAWGPAAAACAIALHSDCARGGSASSAEVTACSCAGNDALTHAACTQRARARDDGHLCLAPCAYHHTHTACFKRTRGLKSADKLSSAAACVSVQ